MRSSRLIRPIGFALAGLVAIAIGVRSSLKAQQPAAIATAFVGGAFGGGKEGDASPPTIYLPAPSMTLAETKTRLKLHEKLAMNFPTDTPLQDVLKYIEQSTSDKADFPEGIAIYVDPQGLQDADKTTTSTITINLKNLPLETTLELLLKQLGLTYWINKDGLLIITAADEDLVTPSTLDLEILTNLSSLRSEVQALRSEIRSLRRGEGGEPVPGERPPTARAPTAGVGGFR